MTRLWADIKRKVIPEGWAPRWSQMALWQRRVIKTVVAVVLLIIVSSLVYHYVLIIFEDRTPSFSHSLQVMVEIFTGTGFGSDSPWESPVTNLFVSVMDLSTFLLLFIIVPYVFRPVIETALSPTVPTAVNLSDHVVICGVKQQAGRLIDEFEARDIEYVVITPSKETAMELVEADRSVIHGDPTSANTHRNANLDEARSAVVDIEDEQSVSAVLAMREVNETIRTVVLVEELTFERHLNYAGADRVMTPRHLLGRRIADRITTEISPVKSDIITVQDDFSILELTVFEESPIFGKPIGEVEMRPNEEVTVLGLWKAGEFIEVPTADTVIDESTVLLVSGEEAAVRELEEETYRGREVEPTVIIAGHGEVGAVVTQQLRDSSAECIVVDIEQKESVDVVGDITHEDTLEAAGIDIATIFVVTIADDNEAILSVLLANERNSNLDIIVRLNDDENETKVRRAGADYVLSLPEMSGRVLAKTVLQEEVLSLSRQLKTVWIDGESFAGQTIEQSTIGEGKQCVAAAIERDEMLITELSPDFVIEPEDRLLVIGSDRAIDTLTS